MYWDKSDGWEFQEGNYKLFSFEAGLQDEHHLTLKLVDSKGTGQIDLGVIKVEVLHKGKLYCIPQKNAILFSGMLFFNRS